MGFTPKRKLYDLTWSTGPWEGFEVTMESVPVRQLIELAAAADKAVAAAGDGLDTGALDGLYEMVASKIVSWNLEVPEGNPVEPTVEALLEHDLDMLLAIIQTWTSAMTEVDAPLGGSSTGGGPSVELSIPMDVSSVPLAS